MSLGIFCFAHCFGYSGAYQEGSMSKKLIEQRTHRGPESESEGMTLRRKTTRRLRPYHCERRKQEGITRLML